MQQVSRVKSETLTLVQKESENELQKAVTAAIADRDKYWQEVINKTEDDNAKALAAKVIAILYSTLASIARVE